MQNLTVVKVDRKYIKDFIEKYHYSHSINGCITDYCYALMSNNLMIGAMFYGRMAMRNQWRKFSDDEKKVIELRRLVLIDEAPKNTESFFIAKSLKLLSSDWRSDGVVVSYADKEYGHSGIIYKASNFVMVGELSGAKVINFLGKLYHDKAIRTKYKGKLKPFAKRLKDSLKSGIAVYKKTAGKFCYVYYLDSKLRELKRESYRKL